MKEKLFDGKRYEFDPKTDFGTLDWGRGVWTYDNTWYWGSGNADINGNSFGFNIGYGFGNTSAATENVMTASLPHEKKQQAGNTHVRFLGVLPEHGKIPVYKNSSVSGNRDPEISDISENSMTCSSRVIVREITGSTLRTIPITDTYCPWLPYAKLLTSVQGEK